MNDPRPLTFYLHLSDTYSEKVHVALRWAFYMTYLFMTHDIVWHSIWHFIWQIFWFRHSTWYFVLTCILNSFSNSLPTWHFFWHSVWLNAERTLYSSVIFYLFYWGQTTVGVTCAYMYASPSEKLYVCSPLLHCSVFLPKCTHECTWRKT